MEQEGQNLDDGQQALPVRSQCSEAGKLPLGQNRCPCRRGLGSIGPRTVGRAEPPAWAPTPLRNLGSWLWGCLWRNLHRQCSCLPGRVSDEDVSFSAHREHKSVENTKMSRIQKSLRKSRNAEKVDGQKYSPQHYLYAQRAGKHFPGQH